MLNTDMDSNESKKLVIYDPTDSINDIIEDRIEIKRIKKRIKDFIFKTYNINLIKALNTKEILNLLSLYEKKFKQICIKYASRLQKLLNGYEIPLSRLFSFRIDKLLYFIIDKQESNVIGPDTIEKMIQKIKDHYTKRRDLSLDLLKFLEEYLVFSGTFYRRSFNSTFSLLRFTDNSKQKLEPRSWLIENLRFIFPKLFGIPINNILLSWFLFGDIPQDDGGTRLTKIFRVDRKYRRPHPYILLSIEYRIQNLSIRDFQVKKIEITPEELHNLKENTSKLIFQFIFSNLFNTGYISNKTETRLPVGKSYFIPEYFLIRELYFSMKHIEKTRNINLKDVSTFFGIKKHLNDYLSAGIGIGIKNLEKIERKIEGLIIDSYQKNKIEVEIERFRNVLCKRSEIITVNLGFRSFFQLKVHYFMEDLFRSKFIQDFPIQSMTGSKFKYKCIDEDISKFLHFDGYCKLSNELNQKLNIDKIWQGIAFEAHGTWHKDEVEFYSRWNNKLEVDRERRIYIDEELKPNICRKYNIIFLVIYENDSPKDWLKKIIQQFNKQIDNKISNSDFPLWI
ncbi:MAG: hypothetical protein ACTSWK_01540 [Promethearchaeota archaeon]